MSLSPLIVAGEVRVDDARRMADKSGVEHFLVTEGRAPIGIVCVKNLGDATDARPIRELVAGPLVSLGAALDFESALSRMQEKNCCCAVVTAGGVVVGLITEEALLGARANGHQSVK